MDITNQLAEETTLHWHGLEVPGEIDGGPQGLSRRAPPDGKLHASAAGGHLLVSPHQHGTTGRQVAMGLAGLVLIEDEESGRLLLPKRGESMMCR